MGERLRLIYKESREVMLPALLLFGSLLNKACIDLVAVDGLNPHDDSTGYTDNICIKFEDNSKSYITGLREGTEYEIVVDQGR